MKLIFKNKKELIDTLTLYTKFDVTDFSIENEIPVAVPLIWENINSQMISRFGCMPPLGGDKIDAIKYLRVVVPQLCLEDSEWAIEHWKRWSEFVKTARRLPVIVNRYNNECLI